MRRFQQTLKRDTKMKITIEGTNQQVGYIASSTYPQDDLEIYTVVELFKQTLMAYGFQPESIKRYFEEGE